MLRVLGRVGFDAAVVAALLFISAGSVSWWRAWVLILFLISIRTVSAIVVYRTNASLMHDRARLGFRTGQPRTDRVLLVAVLLSGFVAVPVIAGLDAYRYRWLAPPGPNVTILGLVLFSAGWALKGVTLRTNAFATAAVYLQAERKHILVDTGVYQAVRHPFYAGTILVLVGLGLWLESYASVLFTAVPVSFIMARIVSEERFLRRVLPGYHEYTLRVRYRLVPHVW